MLLDAILFKPVTEAVEKESIVSFTDKQVCFLIFAGTGSFLGLQTEYWKTFCCCLLA